MINLSISESYASWVDAHLLETAAALALAREGESDEVELTIVVEGDEAIHELNRTYLGVDAPTDVLSFPADVIDPDTQLRYLGDIIISYPRAQAQALTAGVETAAEMQLLVVHGVLHLLGYDHASEAEKRAMWEVQAAILSDLGVKIDRLPE